MRIDTCNRLAHLQIELQELIQQTNCLQSQVQPRVAQIKNMEQYLMINSGDRKMAMQYKKLCREYRTLCTKISTNNRRIASLQNRVGIESQKSMMGYARQRRTY